MGEAISPFSRGQKQITEVKKVTHEMLKFDENAYDQKAQSFFLNPFNSKLFQMMGEPAEK